MITDTDKTGRYETEDKAQKAVEKLAKKNAKYYTIVSTDVLKVTETRLGSPELAESVRMIEAGVLALPLPDGYWQDGNFYHKHTYFQGVVTFENHR